MNREFTGILKVSIYIIGLITLSLYILWLPWVAKEAAAMNPEFAYLRYPVLFGLYATGIPFYLALFQALKLLKCIEMNNAFSELAVQPLREIKKCSIAIIGIYVVGMIFLATQGALHPGLAIMGAVIIFAALIITLFAAVLSQLLGSVLVLKSEND